VSAILERYVARTRESARLNGEARGFMPGGDTRSTAWFAPYPPFAREGSGAFFTDADGNRNVELLNNYTSLIHGHAHPVVTEAIRAQLGRGASFAAPHENTVRLARMLCDRVESIERVRFTNSGTEAVMMAVRVARRFTGRPLLAVATNGYHGMWDDVQVNSPPDGTLVIPYDDLDGARTILEPLGDRLAAVIVEPMQGSGGMIPADPAYLQGLRALTKELGALLILDEVITFRLSSGGMQELVGVRPDLTTIGKVIGGGLPVGAFGGREDVMAVTDPGRPGSIPHKGTFNGNPATTAGGIAALELLTPDEYERLNALGDRLRDGVEALGLTATGVGSLLNVHAAERQDLLHLALLNEGLFVAPRGLMSISTPMDDALVDEVLEGIRRAALAVDAEQPALVS
jgi:glutamate-1-semialdehyde 2,1-aminomutase